MHCDRSHSRTRRFDRARRGFPARCRRLLELLRPTLEAARAEWTAPARLAPLSPREQEVVQLVALGLSNGEVARRLWLSPHTVRTHLENVYRKLGVANRTEAAALVRGAS